MARVAVFMVDLTPVTNAHSSRADGRATRVIACRPLCFRFFGTLELLVLVTIAFCGSLALAVNGSPETPHISVTMPLLSVLGAVYT